MKIPSRNLSLGSGIRQLPRIRPGPGRRHGQEQFHARRQLLPSSKTRPVLESPRLLPTLARRQCARPFSAATALDASVATLQHLYTGLHYHLGTPWFLTIPLIALALNFVARLPVSLYLHGINKRRATFAPLLRAWYVRHARHVAKQRLPPGEEKRSVGAAFRRSQAELYRATGSQAWKSFAPVAVLPIWLAGIEAMRRMCGAPRGMLGNAVFGPGKHAPMGEGPVNGSTAVAWSGATDAVPTDAAWSAVDSAVLPTDLTLGIDMSLATGGCLWFPDLMAADPLHILPFALSAVLALNVIPKSPKGTSPIHGIRSLFNLSPDGRQGSGDGESASLSAPSLRVLNRILFVAALAIGPITMDLPAALHLYWLSSATITLVQSEILRRLTPLGGNHVQPCRGSESTLIRPRRGS